MNEIEQAVPSPECTRGEILVVDDSLASLSLLSSVLTQAGFLVREAPSGELALWTLKTRRPELILLDVRMPGMDGFEVCRRIKADPATEEIPVIFLSAQDEIPDKVRGLGVGAVDFIVKNFAHEEILARIDTHIALARVKKALERERAHLEIRVQERTEELRQGKELLQSVIDSGPDWIHVVDRDYKLLMANQSMALALGHADVNSLIGKFDCELFPTVTCFSDPGDRTCAFHRDELEVLSGKTIFHPRERLTVSDGRTLFFETYKTPLNDTYGKPYGVLCYRRDITRRLQLEEERQALERELWQAKKMEAIGQLAGGIAHDFNHMLSLILGYAQFARTSVAIGKTEKLDYYLSEVINAATSGQAVVAQLLAFSRTDEVATEVISIGEHVREAIDALRPSLGEKCILELRLEPSLPPVLLTAVQVRQMITNLVLNARDAIVGEGKIVVSCGREPIAGPRRCSSCHQDFQGDYVVLSVSDTGSGIDSSAIEKIFLPFYTTKDVGKGSGLGLPMVHGIVHSAGGHIEVVSDGKSGTEFLVRLPVAGDSHWPR